jgi:hypothetical protein
MNTPDIQRRLASIHAALDKLDSAMRYLRLATMMYGDEDTVRLAVADLNDAQDRLTEVGQFKQALAQLTTKPGKSRKKAK